MAKRAQRFGQPFADVRSIPLRRDVIGRRHVIERMPLAEKLGVGHLQSEGAALETVYSLSNSALATGALFCWPKICLNRIIIDKAARRDQNRTLCFIRIHRGMCPRMSAEPSCLTMPRSMASCCG
jgi:hypothetical protein